MPGVVFQCLEEAGGDWSEVSKCVDGDEGKKLQLNAEIETKEISIPKLENVPTIVFNNVCLNRTLSHIHIHIIQTPTNVNDNRFMPRILIVITHLNAVLSYFLPFLFQKYDSELNNKALKGLKAVLCDMLSGKNIPDCA